MGPWYPLLSQTLPSMKFPDFSKDEIESGVNNLIVCLGFQSFAVGRYWLPLTGEMGNCRSLVTCLCTHWPPSPCWCPPLSPLPSSPLWNGSHLCGAGVFSRSRHILCLAIEGLFGSRSTKTKPHTAVTSAKWTLALCLPDCASGLLLLPTVDTNSQRLHSCRVLCTLFPASPCSSGCFCSGSCWHIGWS